MGGNILLVRGHVYVNVPISDNPLAQLFSSLVPIHSVLLVLGQCSSTSHSLAVVVPPQFHDG